MQYWFVDALWDEGDQTQRLVQGGIWRNGFHDRFTNQVQSMREGDRIAIKACFTRKHGLPFDNKGQTVSVMRVKAIGTLMRNHGDRCSVDVAWNAGFTPRDWFFYTYRSPVSRARIEDGMQAKRLVAFTFAAAQQDYAAFMAHQIDEIAS